MKRSACTILLGGFISAALLFAVEAPCFAQDHPESLHPAPAYPEYPNPSHNYSEGETNQGQHFAPVLHPQDDPHSPTVGPAESYTPYGSNQGYQGAPAAAYPVLPTVWDPYGPNTYAPYGVYPTPPVPGFESKTWMMLKDGSRIAVEIDPMLIFSIASENVEADFYHEDILQITMLAEGEAVVQFKNGDRITGYLEMEHLEISTSWGGLTKIEREHIHSISSDYRHAADVVPELHDGM